MLMARPLLADPELPNKLRSGRRQAVRECLSCQNCIDSMLVAPFDANMHCAVNGFSGRELTRVPRQVERPARVLVIGAGTAGMEVARQCAGNGHRVTLVEQSPRLGGSLFYASLVHSDNQALLRYLTREVRRLPIDLRLNTRADAALVRELAADAVVVASGARLELPEVPGRDLPHVVDAWALRQVLSGLMTEQAGAGCDALWMRLARRLPRALWGSLQPEHLRRLSRLYLPVGRRVCVVGDDLVALEFAEFLQRRGRGVTLLCSAPVPAMDVGPKRRQEQLARFDRLGGKVLAESQLQALQPSGLSMQFAGREHVLDFDTVVLAGQPRGEDALTREIGEVTARIWSIGDCTGPGLIRQAVEQATEVACEIGVCA